MLSVVITTFNRRAFLPQAIESVLNQDYRVEEIIVVDDGSNDGSYEVVRRYPVRYVWKENGGISSARNLGIKLTKGEYLAFLDVDDCWLKKKVSTQIEAMEKEGYKISYTDEIWIKDGKRINQKKKHRKYSGLIYDKCLPLCIISPSSAIIRREVFEDVGYFDEDLPVCEDYDMWLRISAKYSVLFIDKPLIVKRGGHPDQLSKKYEAMDKFRIKALLKILNSGILSPDQRRSTLMEIAKKSLIVAKGAEKRGKLEEASYYFSLGSWAEACAQQDSNLQPSDS